MTFSRTHFMGSDHQLTPRVILIAPNVSDRMGGEAIKALQIYQSLVERGVEVHQITHSRVRGEILQNHPEMKVTYVEEDWVDSAIWFSVVFRYFIDSYFMFRAAKVARRLIEEGFDGVVHYTSPISPVIPLFRIPGAKVVVGPINGNIHHPEAFRNRESLSEKFRRLALVPSQWIHRLFFTGKQTADVILVAGGARTIESLRVAGCRDEQFRDTLDSGIADELRETPLIEHNGVNFRFVHLGRLVAYKGTDLAIKAVARTRNPIMLDVIGDGEERARLETLVEDLGVSHRVRFKGWLKHTELIPALRSYRGLVAPSLAEANGIVFQEAMMLGLPVICLNWGGPSQLVSPETGFAIPPTDEESTINGIAQAMDRLGEDDRLARSMAEAGRYTAIDRGFSWGDLISNWIAIYQEIATSNRPSFTLRRPSAEVG